MTYNQAVTAPATSGGFAPLVTLGRTLRQWNDLRQTRKALSRLNDHLLEDIGLTRGDVEALELGRRK